MRRGDYNTMREITADQVTDTVSALFHDVCYQLPHDVRAALEKAKDAEQSPVAGGVLSALLKNAKIAAKGEVPLCQDTGMAVVFLELGQNLHIVGGDLNEAVNEGVRKAYIDGFLRKSVVDRPFSERINTQDNTPAVIHTSIVPGDRLRITVLAKGFGSENMSQMAMLLPAAGRDGIVESLESRTDKGLPDARAAVIALWDKLYQFIEGRQMRDDFTFAAIKIK